MSLLERVETSAERRDASLSATLRARRGVVHTPAALARFIAARAGRPGEATTILDPACGPGVFLAASLENGGGPPRAVLGWDVDADALLGAERDLGPAFAASGWPLALVHGDALASVPSVAGDVIVLGNPPWTAKTASRGVTDALLDDFRRDERGAPLGERKIGVLSDAYVRFLRWGLAVLEGAPGGGVLAMVVNSSFLDGRVHRGMRSTLARALDRIELYDLGGSALVARPPGVRDDNVFGVRPGAVVFVGRRSADHRGPASVAATRIVGSRAEKLAVLGGLAQGQRALDAIALEAPLFRFVPRTHAGFPAAWPAIDAWMPWSREGLQTNRDELCIDTDRDALLARIRAFVAAPSPALARAHFDPELAAARLRREEALERFVVPIAYRWLFAHPALCHRPRPDIATALGHRALALVTAYKDRGQRPFAHLGIVDAIADNCWLSARSSCRARVLPVLRPDGSENVGASVRAQWAAIAGAPPSADQVLRWIAAHLGAPRFRERYDEALRTGPPRIPLPRDRAQIERVVAAGDALVRAFVAEIGPGLELEPLTVGHHRLAASPRAAAVAKAQREASDALSEGDLADHPLVGSPA